MPGIYNIVDDDPAPVSQWLPELAAAVGAKPPYRIPAWLGRLAVGNQGLATPPSGLSEGDRCNEPYSDPAHSKVRRRRA
jgi:hypothetical protein